MHASLPQINRWTAYATWNELRADRAQLLADLRAGASPQVIAADKASVAGSSRRLSVQAGRIDVTV